MWLDELSLTGNIVGKPVLISRNLANDQLAPFGFLIFQRASPRSWATRTSSCGRAPDRRILVALFSSGSWHVASFRVARHWSRWCSSHSPTT